jgi:hypothetical protein
MKEKLRFLGLDVHAETERIDHTAHVIGRYKIVQNYGKQRALIATFTFVISLK